MNEIKRKYNHTLKRFENGCKYLSKNPNEVSKYIPEMISIFFNTSHLQFTAHKFW